MHIEWSKRTNEWVHRKMDERDRQRTSERERDHEIETHNERVSEWASVAPKICTYSNRNLHDGNEICRFYALVSFSHFNGVARKLQIHKQHETKPKTKLEHARKFWCVCVCMRLAHTHSSCIGFKTDFNIFIIKCNFTIQTTRKTENNKQNRKRIKAKK